jgi:hypothetical protein
MTPPSHAGNDSTSISRYLTEATALIASRLNEIASTAVRHRPRG